MKILLNCHVPFMLAHGGMQIQIEQTKAALEKIGVEAEYLRWWDEKQTGDIFQYFGRIPTGMLLAAQAKGMKVVMADLMTGQGSRTPRQLQVQRFATRLSERFLPRMITGHIHWDSYRLADACVALTGHEAWLMSYMFQAPPERVHVVPNGVEEVFLHSRPATRGPWLVCTATITERKRVLELAEAAILAQTPVWVVGKPYSESDPYSRRFVEMAKQNPQFVRYEGPIRDRARMAEVYREARGFALLSTMESLSLSALEAAACECPLLLGDLPWARTVFKESAAYCPVTGDAAKTAAVLRAFYDTAPGRKAPARPLNWVEVARQFKAIYDQLLQRRP